MSREVQIPTAMSDIVSPDQLAAFFGRERSGNVLLTPEGKQAQDLVRAYNQVQADMRDGVNFGESTFHNYHKILAHSIPHLQMDPGRYIGRYHIAPKEIRGDEQADLAPILPPERVVDYMRQLGSDFGDYMGFESTLPEDIPTVVSHASNFLWRFSYAHPYADGNGRLGRLATDGILLAGGLHQIPQWTEDKNEGRLDKRKEYLGALRTSIRSRDDKPFGVFLAKREKEAFDIELRRIQMNEKARLQASDQGLVNHLVVVKQELENYIQR